MNKKDGSSSLSSNQTKLLSIVNQINDERIRELEEKKKRKKKKK